MSTLWSSNIPASFWLCDSNENDELWKEAMRRSSVLLGLKEPCANPDDLLAMTLGEGQFGPTHWNLGAAKWLYYLAKPILPRPLLQSMRRRYHGFSDKKPLPHWPIDPRYALFQWEVLRQLLLMNGRQSIGYTRLWPDAHRFALTLTHDIETAAGQAFVREIAELEERLDFRSSFNFVLERYALDLKLMQELRERGFEVGCHGLKHDGRLFVSPAEFAKRARGINAYLEKFQMVGFRSPLTHRNPEWMQALEIEYDSSFFDTDPFEPIPGGVMTIWPFFLGRFVELPYTLVQDHTLTAILGETTPRIWIEKVEFIKKYHGMALLNSHPDYLRDKTALKVYTDFLESMKEQGGYWNALPRDAARWWRKRAETASHPDLADIPFDTAALASDQSLVF